MNASFLVPFGLLVISICYQRMSSTPASPLPAGAVWADHPLALVETPLNQSGKVSALILNPDHELLMCGTHVRPTCSLQARRTWPCFTTVGFLPRHDEAAN